MGIREIMLSAQVKKNYEAFDRKRSELESKNLGRTALLHDGEIVAIYNDSYDAYQIGCEKFGLGHFSIETFGETPTSLGFYTIFVQPEKVTN